MTVVYGHVVTIFIDFGTSGCNIDNALYANLRNRMRFAGKHGGSGFDKGLLVQ